jgi:hypothetical protein
LHRTQTNVEDRQCTRTYKRNLEARSTNHCCRAKAISTTFWASDWSVWYPVCNAHAPYCHLWPVWQHNIFPRYFINCTIFERKKLFNIKCAYWFSLKLLPERFLILRRTERDTRIVWSLYWSWCQVSVILVRFYWYFNCVDRFSKNIQI